MVEGDIVKISRGANIDYEPSAYPDESDIVTAMFLEWEFGTYLKLMLTFKDGAIRIGRVHASDMENRLDLLEFTNP